MTHGTVTRIVSPLLEMVALVSCLVLMVYLISKITTAPTYSFQKNDIQKVVMSSLSSNTHLSFREWQTYFKDPYNYFDWLGLILTFLVIPLRFVGVDSQWSVAALGYLFNFLRLFKFSCVTRYFYA